MKRQPLHKRHHGRTIISLFCLECEAKSRPSLKMCDYVFNFPIRMHLSVKLPVKVRRECFQGNVWEIEFIPPEIAGTL